MRTFQRADEAVEREPMDQLVSPPELVLKKYLLREGRMNIWVSFSQPLVIKLIRKPEK